MCNYCQTPIYIKTIQYCKSLLAPLTPEQELRDKLLDMTGEVYVNIPKKYCPYCGAAMTDEAVQMVMKRLEVLKDESQTD